MLQIWPSHVCDYYQILFSSNFESHLHLLLPKSPTFSLAWKALGGECIQLLLHSCAPVLFIALYSKSLIFCRSLWDGLHPSFVPRAIPNHCHQFYSNTCLQSSPPSFMTSPLYCFREEKRVIVSLLKVNMILALLLIQIVTIFLFLLQGNSSMELFFATSRFFSLWNLVQSKWHPNKSSEVSLVLVSNDFHLFSGQWMTLCHSHFMWW